MDQSVYTVPLKNGTITGAILIFFANINSGDIGKTVLLAATGSVVSFLVSFLMKWLGEKWKRR